MADKKQKCTKCDGTGWVKYVGKERPYEARMLCPDCKGHGKK